MNIGQVVGVVVGALIAFIIATTLITSLITDTLLASASGQLVSNIVPIACSAGAVIIILRQFLK